MAAARATAGLLRSGKPQALTTAGSRGQEVSYDPARKMEARHFGGDASRLCDDRCVRKRQHQRRNGTSVVFRHRVIKCRNPRPMRWLSSLERALSEGQAEKAHVLLIQILKRPHLTSDFLLRVGIQFAERERYEEAAEVFQRCIQEHPESL